MYIVKNNSKLQIYKGVIQYLLESTNYTLKNIADLSGASIINIRSIYLDGCIPPAFSSELQLFKLFLAVFQIELNCNLAKSDCCSDSLVSKCVLRDRG